MEAEVIKEIIKAVMKREGVEKGAEMLTVYILQASEEILAEAQAELDPSSKD